MNKSHIIHFRAMPVLDRFHYRLMVGIEGYTYEHLLEINIDCLYKTIFTSMFYHSKKVILCNVHCSHYFFIGLLVFNPFYL